MFRGKSLIFFIPNSCVFSCWSQKTSKWVENITQTHSHSILIGPPTPTWFPFAVSLQARILFASKLISQKLLSFILTIFISHILSSTLRLKIKLQQELLKNFPHNKCLFGNRLQKVSKWIKSVSLTHSLEFQWPANTYVISGFRFSSERKCIGFPWLTSQERDSVLFLRDSRVIFASAEESSAWTIWPLNSRYVSSATDHGRADVYVFLVVAFSSSFSAMNAFTFVCNHSLKLSVITNSMFVVLYLNSGLIINVWLILRSSSAYTKGVRHLMIVFLFSTTSVHGVPF